jgi:hypothetical protein
MRWFALVLAALVSTDLTVPLQAQQMMLNILVVQGEGAINNIRQRTARQTIVRVEDENHRPVSGAAVVFSLPSQGAGGTFAGGAQTLTVMSTKEGIAVAKGFRPNQLAGQFQMHVNASFAGQTATATIAQTNAVAAVAAGAGAGAAAAVSTKLIVIVAVAAGAAAAGGAVAATRSGGGGSSTTSTPTVISPGTGTVGAPH